MTLGISTNTRLLGLAIINHGELEEYKMYLHKSPWSAWKANAIVTSLEPCVRQYCIKRVVLSIPHVYHQTKEFRHLIRRLKKYFEAQAIPVYEESVATIYSLCPSEHKKTKKTLMGVLTALYPHLTLCYRKELQNKNKYYIKVFEAAGAATVHHQNQ